VIYKVCVTVVVHRHEFVRLYGDPAHRRIYIYKKDAETHYDPLLPIFPIPAASHTSAAVLVTEVSDGDEGAASARDEGAASAPFPDGADGGEAGDEGVFVYGGVRCAAAKVTVGSDGVDSTSTASDHLADGIPLAASAPLPHTVSQGMVVYGGV